MFSAKPWEIYPEKFIYKIGFSCLTCQPQQQVVVDHRKKVSVGMRMIEVRNVAQKPVRCESKNGTVKQEF